MVKEGGMQHNGYGELKARDNNVPSCRGVKRSTSNENQTRPFPVPEG